MSRRILVVDDDTEVLALFELFLGMHGWFVYRAESGRKAVEIAAREHRIDAMLCDIRMPDMDGFDVVTAVRELGCTFPVCMHTAYDTVDALSRVGDMGIQDIIFKPSPPDVVLTKLSMVLDDHERLPTESDC